MVRENEVECTRSKLYSQVPIGNMFIKYGIGWCATRSDNVMRYCVKLGHPALQERIFNAESSYIPEKHSTISESATCSYSLVTLFKKPKIAGVQGIVVA